MEKINSDAIAEFFNVSAMLSNIAYNIKQDERIPESIRKSCADVQAQYDAVSRRARQAIEMMQNVPAKAKLERTRTENTFADVIRKMRQDIERLKRKNMKYGPQPKRKAKR